MNYLWIRFTDSIYGFDLWMIYGSNLRIGFMDSVYGFDLWIRFT